MKRIYKILSVCVLTILTMQSCEKKNQAADQLVLETNNSPSEALEPSQMNTENANTASPALADSKSLTNLVLSDNVFDFGDIKKGDLKSHTYEVTNTGKYPLIISEVKPACGCTVPEFTKDPIMPGQKGQVTLKFESAGFDGVVQKTAQIFANVEKAPITIGFTANIK